MDAEENQRQVFLRAHSPWKSRGDFHIPTAATISYFNNIQKGGPEAELRSSPGSSFDWNMLAGRSKSRPYAKGKPDKLRLSWAAYLAPVSAPALGRIKGATQ